MWRLEQALFCFDLFTDEPENEVEAKEEDDANGKNDNQVFGNREIKW